MCCDHHSRRCPPHAVICQPLSCALSGVSYLSQDREEFCTMTTTPGANEDRFLRVIWDVINLSGNDISSFREREELCAHHKRIIQRVSVPAKFRGEKGRILELRQEDRHKLLNSIQGWLWK